MGMLPFSGASFKVKVDTRANILASTTTSGKLAYATDTIQFYYANGSVWETTPFSLVPDHANPDMGYIPNSLVELIGIDATTITDKTLYNTTILGNANSTTGSIRTLAGQLQIYLNGKWNNVVINFVFTEDANYGYALEHQPVGYSTYIEIMTGNSVESLDMNNIPFTQGYVTSMGCFAVAPILDCNTF